MNWFEVTAKYVKMDENGHEKKVSEMYLLDAVSFGEAETRMYKELETMVSGEFSVRKIQMSNISEIIPSDIGDRWFKGKVTFITVSEETGKEKRVSQSVLVFAETVEQADKNIKEAMKFMMAEFEISAIVESKILDVFPYTETKDIHQQFLNDEIKSGDYYEATFPNASKEIKELLNS
jgi:hypothetical protein